MQFTHEHREIQKTLKRFIDDRCFETAGSLSYTSILAVVPFAAVVVGVFSRAV